MAKNAFEVADGMWKLPNAAVLPSFEADTQNGEAIRNREVEVHCKSSKFLPLNPCNLQCIF